MKEEVLKLRKEGKTYKQITELTGVSKSMVCYYCGDNQKEKRQNRTKKYRGRNKMHQKLSRYKNKKKISSATRDFQRRDKGKLLNKAENYDFTYKDVLDKFGENTICYLSGEKINLLEDLDYCFDHKKSCNDGGDNSFDNLGITKTKVNKMKHHLSVDEFLEWCIKILKHNGYKVEK